MKPTSIKAQFDTTDFQAIREAAARAGLPIRHWAQRVLIAESRRAAPPQHRVADRAAGPEHKANDPTDPTTP